MRVNEDKDYGDPISDEVRDVASAAQVALNDVYNKLVADTEDIAGSVPNIDYSEFLIAQEALFDGLIAQIGRANDV